MENDELMKELLKAMFKMRKVKPNFHGDCKLKMHDVLALDIIDQNEKEEDQNIYFSQIQSFMQVSKPAVSQLLASLEKRGYLKREIDVNDKRKFVMQVTSDGKKELAIVKKAVEEMIDDTVDKLGEEDTRELIRLFNKMSLIAQEQRESFEKKE